MHIIYGLVWERKYRPDSTEYDSTVVKVSSQRIVRTHFYCLPCYSLFTLVIIVPCPLKVRFSLRIRI